MPTRKKSPPEDLKHVEDPSWDLPPFHSDPINYCFVILMKNLVTHEHLSLIFNYQHIITTLRLPVHGGIEGVVVLFETVYMQRDLGMGVCVR